jgi:signal transduction histidine kinase
VSVDVRDSWLTVRVTDDGVGFIETPSTGRGVENLRSRATQGGGTFEIGRSQSGGTEVRWAVPLRG